MACVTLTAKLRTVSQLCSVRDNMLQVYTEMSCSKKDWHSYMDEMYFLPEQEMSTSDNSKMH